MTQERTIAPATEAVGSGDARAAYVPPFERRDFTSCVHCGLCLEACPTYRETFEEGLSARGRIDLIRAFAERSLAAAGESPRSLDLCLACASCQAACPSGVRYLDLIAKARSWLAAARSPRRDRHVLRTLRLLFLRPRLLRLALRIVRSASRSGLAALAVRLLFAKSHRPHFRLLAESLRATMAGPSRRGPRADPVSPRLAPSDSPEVLLFRGCTTPVLFPEVMRALESILARLRIPFGDPPAQGCCGALLLHHGDIASARRLARRNIAAFEQTGDGPILVEAAGCGAVLKAYGELLADDPKFAERARRFAARIRDVSEFLADRLPALSPASPLPLHSAEDDAALPAAPMLVVYQDPCHLRHLQGIVSAPRELLDRLPGIRRATIEEEDLCCGSAGIYNLLEPEMSARLAARKVAHLAATGAQMVISANPGCRIQLAGRLRREGIEMRHLIELCAERWPAAAGECWRTGGSEGGAA